MTPGDALRRAANTLDTCAIGDRRADAVIMLARYVERVALGTAHEDEAGAVVRALSWDGG